MSRVSDIQGFGVFLLNDYGLGVFLVMGILVQFGFLGFLGPGF